MGMPRTKLRVPSMGSMHPAEAGRSGRVAVLLAEEAVVGEGMVERLAQALFGFAVGDGDGAVVVFPFDRQLGLLEVAQGQLAGARAASTAAS